MMMLVVLDRVIAYDALPRIGIALGICPAVAVWIGTAYQLGVFVALLPAATLSESLRYWLVPRRHRSSRRHLASVRGCAVSK